MPCSHYALPGCFLLVALASCSEPTAPADEPQTAEPELATTASALSFYQVSGGSFRTCGITADQRAYCWGQGLLGDGRDYRGPASSKPVAVSGGLRFIQI